MAVRTKIDPIDRDIELLLAEELSPAAQSAALASFAMDQLSDAQEINTRALGHSPAYQQFVDGRPDAALAQVRPDGVIIFEFEIVSDVIEFIEQQLLRISPVKTGRYRKSHVLFADDQEIQFGADVPAAAEYVFLNLQPYARKIERGPSRQTPGRVFEAVAVLAAKRYGNVARVKFGYRTPLYGAIDSWAKRSTMVRKGRGMTEAKRGEWLRRQPAIIVTGR